MSIELTGMTILVLAPHTDDGELGAGASLAKWVRGGNDVHYVALSACETIQGTDLPRDILSHECRRATSELGIDPDHFRVYNFEVRHFDRERQGILDLFVQLNAELQPDLTLVPSTDDTHQDHYVVWNEARRAFKRTRMLGYEVPWNNFRFDTTAFAKVARQDADRKIQALAHFNSQKDRIYMTQSYQEAQLRFRGVQAGCEFAEAFQVLRWYL